ncbi:16S rRNA (cytosine(967)-C(5))-methyltransferase RsmB [Streptococcus sobrinus]|uniref:16S rRNA (cytosine(967)-C(5))-methyltransferase n=1 Tax=Streptococcus sobrinus TaxID=1310 RepID=A0ABN5LKY7_9STRE|nr:16S rRNA (cytosine(967)-C(5))-methyltransferase RsmB [Streptococcus sobrinus]AWN21481.1 16S rRNA (cytosine(967)-C(5))-methyltransferase RsmB [Streptococcus sobrinus]OZV21876.1 16S rRNA (cytosine(967)-C(5))-methyltransferase RsmB [Streptococcus sobrinus]SQG14302.1 ribosomal RNA small subunit methyltransferase B [Streptococcus sobrinus]
MPLATKAIRSARALALKILEEVFQEGAYSNLALKHGLAKSDLSQQDKALVTEIVYGTVARKITLEWQLAHFIEDREKLEPWVYTLLLLSLYQLIYLNKIPHHAIVNEAVNLAKVRSQKGADKLVNAVLRKLARGPLADPTAIKRKNKRYSVQYSLPVWLVKKTIEQYGEDRAVKIFASLFIRNKASVRVTNPAKLAEIQAATESDRSLLSPVGLVKETGYFAGTDYFEQGDLTIQDESSQLVAPTLKLEGDEQVLDACAAPGGKTAHLASYLTTGQVTALDLYDHKLKLIEENARRLHVADRVTTRKLDARQADQAFCPDSFNKILVDAPCSGIGLIRRKPDIKYSKGSQDFAALQKIQFDILNSVCQTLRKNGIITYSTCTIFEEENQDLISKFLEAHPNFEQVKLEHRQKDILTDGFIRITPELHLTDGFFIAQLKRVY